MANNDYDDLLQSFMNNSRKVYNDDKDQQKAAKENLPSSYSTFSKKKKPVPAKSKSSKSPKAPKKQRSKGAVAVRRTLLALLMIVAVVFVVCASVIVIYSYSVIYGDPVFDLTEEALSQNQTSIIYGYDDEGNTKEITRLHGEENRIWLESDNMSPYLAKRLSLSRMSVLNRITVLTGSELSALLSNLPILVRVDQQSHSS